MTTEDRQKVYAEMIAKYGHHFQIEEDKCIPDDSFIVFTSGNQSFNLSRLSGDMEHLEWMRAMLCIALDKIVKEHTDG